MKLPTTLPKDQQRKLELKLLGAIGVGCIMSVLAFAGIAFTLHIANDAIHGDMTQEQAAATAGTMVVSITGMILWIKRGKK